MEIFFLSILLICLSFRSVLSENILYLAVIPSPSHHIWNRAFALGLVDKGHNVTYICADEDKVPKHQNYTHIVLEGVYEKLKDSADFLELSSGGPLKSIYEIAHWSSQICQNSLQTNGLQKLLQYPKEFKFDLIIIDVSLGSCVYPFIHTFNYPPAIGVTPFLLPQYVSNSFGNPLFPAFIPWYGLPYTTEMSFVERAWNFFFAYADIFIKYHKQYVLEHEVAKKTFGDDIPQMKQLERHMSLVLANTDPILDHPQPLPPNIIPVGGLHTRKSKPVSNNLQQVLDKSENGIILFSLGTNIRSDQLDENTQNELLDAFSKISETVIWKFESQIKNLPKNVIVQAWLPQNDILGHPNVKLFIGHGGALSTQEAVYHGVPMIAIPFIVDQFINAKIIINKRLGVSIDHTKITSEYVLKQLREVLDNPVYGQNMKKISKAFKDRKETPLERGIFWAEYVIRHKGAEFLNTAARDLPFYTTMGLDIMAFLLTVVVLIVVLICKALKIVRILFGTKQKVKIQ